jgi:hypothetical protein
MDALLFAMMKKIKNCNASRILRDRNKISSEQFSICIKNRRLHRKLIMLSCKNWILWEIDKIFWTNRWGRKSQRLFDEPLARNGKNIRKIDYPSESYFMQNLQKIIKHNLSYRKDFNSKQMSTCTNTKKRLIAFVKAIQCQRYHLPLYRT